MKVLTNILFAIFLILLVSCSESTKINENVAILKGTVYGQEDNQQLIKLPGVLVTVNNYVAQGTSDSQGDYQISVELSGENEQETLYLTASKAGYEPGTASVLAKKGETVQVPDITLQKSINDTTGNSGGDTTLTSGDAAHIEVFGTHTQHIYVAGSGLTETARISFVVRDAQGIPVDNDHRVTVHFSILNGPNGGEYIFPDTMTTNQGMVFTVLNSGIKAGPVQIQASATVNGNPIQTTPVRITIYGGLPDPDHFSLAADILNIAGLKFSGIIDHITAFVGDKYSNPVAPGTVVYFSSDYGIIDGSATTDELGRATVQFLTASPRPPSPWDSAWVHITGWTHSDTTLETLISSRTRVLLTDNTAPITVIPSSFTYNNTNTPVSFSYQVNDIWGRPLVGDTKIKVTSTDGDLYGDTDFVLEDTQISGPGTTQFNFTWAPGDSLEAPQVLINIKVTTPVNGNGYQSMNILGTKQ